MDHPIQIPAPPPHSPTLQTAVDHLIKIGFMSRTEVSKAGGVNMLWGLLLQEVNTQVAEGEGGGLLVCMGGGGVCWCVCVEVGDSWCVWGGW